MSHSVFSYAYLESEVNSGLHPENKRYIMSSQLAGWIENELAKRVLEVRAEEGHDEVKVYLTLRDFKQSPVFLLAYPTEDKKTVLEAWYFRMIPSEEHPQQALNLVLDRVPLKRLFRDLNAKSE